MFRFVVVFCGNIDRNQSLSGFWHYSPPTSFLKNFSHSMLDSIFGDLSPSKAIADEVAKQIDTFVPKELPAPVGL